MRLLIIFIAVGITEIQVLYTSGYRILDIEVVVQSHTAKLNNLLHNHDLHCIKWPDLWFLIQMYISLHLFGSHLL